MPNLPPVGSPLQPGAMAEVSSSPERKLRDTPPGADSGPAVGNSSGGTP
jgi:hypothetical protein